MLPVIEPEAEPHACVPSHPMRFAVSRSAVPATTMVDGLMLVVNPAQGVATSQPCRCHAKTGEAPKTINPKADRTTSPIALIRETANRSFIRALYEPRIVKTLQKLNFMRERPEFLRQRGFDDYVSPRTFFNASESQSRS